MPVIALDNLIDDGKVAASGKFLIKLDVEGVEIEAIKGGARLLQADSVILCEEHGNDPGHTVSRYILEQTPLKLIVYDPRSNRLETVSELSILDRIKVSSHVGYNVFGTAPLTQARLREVLGYEPLTGILTWFVSPLNRQGVIKPGDRAGYVHPPKGYRRITIDGREYAEHRVIWFWMTGAWPKDQIDHKDNDKANNRWVNLREANNSQNVMNKPRHRFMRNGLVPKRPYRGVQPHKDGGYQVFVASKHIGLYDTAEEARDAYLAASERHFGEYVNLIKRLTPARTGQ